MFEEKTFKILKVQDLMNLVQEHFGLKNYNFVCLECEAYAPYGGYYKFYTDASKADGADVIDHNTTIDVVLAHLAMQGALPDKTQFFMWIEY